MRVLIVYFSIFFRRDADVTTFPMGGEGAEYFSMTKWTDNDFKKVNINSTTSVPMKANLGKGV